MGPLPPGWVVTRDRQGTRARPARAGRAPVRDPRKRVARPAGPDHRRPGPRKLRGRRAPSPTRRRSRGLPLRPRVRAPCPARRRRPRLHHRHPRRWALLGRLWGPLLGRLRGRRQRPRRAPTAAAPSSRPAAGAAAAPARPGARSVGPPRRRIAPPAVAPLASREVPGSARPSAVRPRAAPSRGTSGSRGMRTRGSRRPGGRARGLRRGSPRSSGADDWALRTGGPGLRPMQRTDTRPVARFPWRCAPSCRRSYRGCHRLSWPRATREPNALPYPRRR